MHIYQIITLCNTVLYVYYTSIQLEKKKLCIEKRLEGNVQNTDSG